MKLEFSANLSWLGEEEKCMKASKFTDAREKLENWRRHYNEDRPHSAIGYNVPIAMHYPDGVTGPSS